MAALAVLGKTSMTSERISQLTKTAAHRASRLTLLPRTRDNNHQRSYHTSLLRSLQLFAPYVRDNCSLPAQQLYLLRDSL